jgi:hypothetical protein
MISLAEKETERCRWLKCRRPARTDLKKILSNMIFNLTINVKTKSKTVGNLANEGWDCLEQEDLGNELIRYKLNKTSFTSHLDLLIAMVVINPAESIEVIKEPIELK